jgi:hypothetical protein
VEEEGFDNNQETQGRWGTDFENCFRLRCQDIGRLGGALGQVNRDGQGWIVWGGGMVGGGETKCVRDEDTERRRV